MIALLHATSRDSLAAAEDRLDGVIDSGSAGELGTLGDQLFAVMRLLIGEPTLRRHLGDASVPGPDRSRLADQLLASKLDRPALDTVNELVGARWSRPADLIDALETLARRAVLGQAEKDRSLAEVEDELFRFGRILDREPELTSLLADTGTPEDKRVELLGTVLGDRVRPVTRTLLEQTVRTPRGRGLDLAAEELSTLAAARRDRYVAHVLTPVALTSAQEQRLSETLTRLYGRDMSLQIEQDTSLLGGLVVRVGDEVIDGSMSARIDAARRSLPH